MWTYEGADEGDRWKGNWAEFVLIGHGHSAPVVEICMLNGARQNFALKEFFARGATLKVELDIRAV